MLQNQFCNSIIPIQSIVIMLNINYIIRKQSPCQFQFITIVKNAKQ